MIVTFFRDNFQDVVWLVAIIVSVIPTIETKIAIPLVISKEIWGNNAINPISACFICFVGSLIPIYFIIIFIRFLKDKTTGFIFDKFISKLSLKYDKEIHKMSEKKLDIFKYILLTSFIAIPLPLTGVWSGSIISGFTNLNIHKCFISISLGSLISCIIMTLLCTIFENSILYIIMATLIILILVGVVNLLFCIKRKKKELI
ncbi:MAG: small multi-drug export protein [Clostridia bacterium]|nr:small multi-drug export protein [Clostridia bacterium]